MPLTRYTKVDPDDEFSECSDDDESRALVRNDYRNTYFFTTLPPPSPSRYPHISRGSSSRSSWTILSLCDWSQKMGTTTVNDGSDKQDGGFKVDVIANDSNEPDLDARQKTKRRTTFDLLGQNELVVQTTVLSLTNKRRLTRSSNSHIPWNIKLLLTMTLLGFCYLCYIITVFAMEGFYDEDNLGNFEEPVSKDRKNGPTNDFVSSSPINLLALKN